MRHGREIRTFARLKGGSETIAPISLLPPTRVSVRSLIIADLDARGAKIVISQHPRRAKPLPLDREIYK